MNKNIILHGHKTTILGAHKQVKEFPKEPLQGTMYLPLILSEEVSFVFLFWLGDFSFSWNRKDRLVNYTVTFRLLSYTWKLHFSCKRHTPQQHYPQNVHTLILWKLIFQFAPALVGMNLSPSLLGEDNGEPVSVRLCRLCGSFCKINKWYVFIYESIKVWSLFWLVHL